MNLGEKIYKLRVEKNLSQADLAEALEVSRQSISKWETGSSVPELDKMVKLSEIFQVSLDELVLDRKPPEPAAEPAPKVIYVERAEKNSVAKVTGIVLLFFAGLLALMLALFGDTLAGFVLAAPFLGCGLACLLVRKGVGLCCAWIVYLFIEIYLRFATGVTWQFVFLPQVYTGMTVHLIVAWSLLATCAVLTIITAIFLRKQFSGNPTKYLIGTLVSWGVYLVTWFVFALPASDQESYVYSQGRIFVTGVSGWVRNIVLIVSLLFTIQLIISFFENQHRK